MRNFCKNNLTISSFVSFFLGLIPAYVFWQLKPFDTVPTFLLFISIIITLFFMFFSIILWSKMDQKINPLIEVKSFTESENQLYIILKPFSSATNDMMITLFDHSDGGEFYLATAHVTNINNEGIVQALIINHKKYTKKQFLTNDKGLWQFIVGKPIVTKTVWDDLRIQDNL